MKVYQLITTPFSDSSDFDGWREMARTPNRVFTTLQGAQDAAQKDLNELIDDTEDADYPIARTPLEWLDQESTEGKFTAEFEAVGIVYAIHATELES